MDAGQLRRTYLSYFAERGHALIGHAPLVPADDAAVLFTPAGMYSLIPFLRGTPHPAGRRLANCQPCLRPDDSATVGDSIHLTVFEMLGSWSLGDYGKAEAIQWSYSFLTERLGLDPARLCISCFGGDAVAPRDQEAAAIWEALGIPRRRLFFMPTAQNWWGPVGATGLCGPDTQIYYDRDPTAPSLLTPNRFWEVWDIVFLEYDRQADGHYERLAQPNIDMGLGLERVLTILQGVGRPYETELFAPLIAEIQARAARPQGRPERVIADHVRAVVCLLAEGVRPGGTEHGAFVRRLITRIVDAGQEIGWSARHLVDLATTAITILAESASWLGPQQESICAVLAAEVNGAGQVVGAR